MPRLALLFLLAVGSCAAPSPAVDPPRKGPVDPTDPFALYALSEEYRGGLEGEPSGDEKQTERVSRLGRKLGNVCDNALARVEFRLRQDNRANALSLPRGPIYINQGLAARIESDAHLAFVIGHELAHVCLRHSAGLLKAHQLLRSTVRDAAERTARLAEVRRSEELEADRYGALYAVRAGFPLSALMGFFDLDLPPEPEAGTSASSHPSKAERKASLAAFGEKLLKARDVFDEAGRAYRSGQYDRAIARLDEFLFFFPNSTAALTNFGAANLRKAVRFLEALPHGLKDELLYIPAPDLPLRGTPEAEYVRRALAAFEKAGSLDPRWVAADINAAAIHIREGREEAARRALERAARLAVDDRRASAVIEIHLGNLAFAASDVPRAAAHYEKALQLDRTAGAAAYDLSIVREKQEKKAEAVALLTELARSPEWTARATARLEGLGAPAPAPAVAKQRPSLAGVRLGTGSEEIRAAFGAVGKTQLFQSLDGEEWSYEDGKLRFLFGIDAATGTPVLAESITVRGGEFRTELGIGVGDAASRVRRSYGEPERVDRLQGRWSYRGGTLFFTFSGETVVEITLMLAR